MPIRRWHFEVYFLEWKYFIKISLKFVSKSPINIIPALVHIMALHQPGNKPLFEPMMIILLTYMCHSASMS